MASSGDPGARAVAKQLKVLMPPSLHKLHISDELAGCFDAAGGGGKHAPVALVVSPFGKVWRVEVGRDGEGAFLGRGWADFLAAHRIGVGWFIVLRHEGGGALTVKAFDTSFCIKEFGAPAAVMASGSSKEVSCKPQFIRLVHQDFMEKMIVPAKFVKHYVTNFTAVYVLLQIIPAKFVKHYVAKEHLNSRTAVVFSPLGKFWRIELENYQSGVFFTGGWSQFLAFHGISEGDVLLLRYEGNMVFKFKAFGLNGFQKDFMDQDTRIRQNHTEKQHEAPSPSRKRKSDNKKSSIEEKKRSKSSTFSPNKVLSPKKTDYQTGPASWIRKEINTYALERVLSLPRRFCHRIGFRNTCTITLKTAMDSTKSWQVRGTASNNARYISGEGWKSFCQENRLKPGNLCTFNVIETTLWHHEQKWNDRCSQKKQKITDNASPRSNTPGTNESRHDEEGEGIISEAVDARPDGKKKEK
ncbi:putative B3 domain-containing protein Os04g0347400 [Phragmites australis]|uniref:putative B3 domain-containing protein Os04g0347400 n=1 Tax=Phragmites australis TaxID=29695 RepID=UPI002D76F9A3|nr:putative B3 domain-containing protein Os04g0347400 [Phragmites australis]